MSYNFTGSYEISENGCWNWTKSLRDGRYGQAYIARKPYRAHRVAWECANKSKIPSGMEVRHKCDNPKCVNPSHLEIGSRQDNVDDKMSRGRHKSKLTISDIDKIKLMLGTHSQARIAAMFGISQQQVSRIKSGENWK